MNFAALIAVIYWLVGIGVVIALFKRGDGTLQDKCIGAVLAVFWPAFLLLRIGIWIGEK